jgi:hypothetical protein
VAVNFDSVAASYRQLETIVFGDQLQQARVAFLGKIDTPHRVLVLNSLGIIPKPRSIALKGVRA